MAIYFTNDPMHSDTLLLFVQRVPVRYLFVSSDQKVSFVQNDVINMLTTAGGFNVRIGLFFNVMFFMKLLGKIHNFL